MCHNTFISLNIDIINIDKICFVYFCFFKGYSHNHWKAAPCCHAVYPCKVCVSCHGKLTINDNFKEKCQAKLQNESELLFQS